MDKGTVIRTRKHFRDDPTSDDNENDTEIVKERKRMFMQKKRLIEQSKRVADRDRKRQARISSMDQSDSPDKGISLVDLCCGCGGQLLAMKLLLETPRYDSYRLRVPFACDISPSKLSLYNSMASSYGFPLATLADITDETYFVHSLIKAWGHVDVLMSSIPCTSFSSLGKRGGLLGVSIQAFVKSILRIISIVLSPVCVFECVTQLESDKLFQEVIIQPLTALGYNCSWFSLDASTWAPTKRKRLFIVCQTDATSFKQFRIPRGQKCREKRLYSCLLRAYDPRKEAVGDMAPLSSYAIKRASKMSLTEADLSIKNIANRNRVSLTASDIAKAMGVSLDDLSRAAKAVWQLPFIRERLHSHVVTYHFDRITQIKNTYGVSPTLVKSSSGMFMIRDTFGVRVLTGREVALIHCYPEDAIKAFESVASSNQIVEAIGDGFVIPVVRDVLRAAL